MKPASQFAPDGLGEHRWHHGAGECEAPSAISNPPRSRGKPKGTDLEVLLQAVHAATPAAVMVAIDPPADPVSVRRARQFVAERCGTWDCDHLVDGAPLVVSELVTNALSHAQSPSQLRLRYGAGVVRVELIDHGDGVWPEPRDPSPREEHGRGLHLIGAVSSAWGVEPHPNGNLVWAEFATAG